MERPFLVFVSEGNTIYVNTSQIRQVIVNENGECDIWFSETHHAHLDGTGAGDFIERISELATALNGEPVNLKRDITLPQKPS
jgi:hypothetical protein